MERNFETIALIGRAADARVRDTLQGLAPHLSERGASVVVAEELEVDFPGARVRRAPEKRLAKTADLMIAIGGDGTMLYASRLVAQHGVPLLGINRGRLGFLADVTPDAMLRSVDDVLAGSYTSEQRLLLQAEVLRDGERRWRELALNDVVLQKLEAGRMLEFETSVNGRFVNAHSSDGFIVASPTGSTAYALSCNGPIVQPELDAIILVPISPHTLSDRPIAIPASHVVDIGLLERRESRALVICDGKETTDLELEDILRVKAADKRLTLIHPPGYDYYRILRSKLHWGRGSSRRPGQRRNRR